MSDFLGSIPGHTGLDSFGPLSLSQPQLKERNMPLNLSVPQNISVDLSPRIVVMGVGGAGGNAVNNMIAAGLNGCDFIAANTDHQALTRSIASKKIQLGLNIARGLGAGSHPEVGRAAADETREELRQHLEGSHMAFIAAGMGGGTGTGAAPVIASVARELGILTVGVVTKPFSFEGTRRMQMAELGLKELQKYVDTLIVIPNQNLFAVANAKTTFADAFKMADDVLHSGVRSITDLIVNPGLVNLDFADVKTVMGEMGKAMMGTGEASGEKRAEEAARLAISNPLIEDTSMKGATGVLINITGAYDITLHEIDEAVGMIKNEVDPSANIIFGSSIDESLEGKMRVSVIATGIDAGERVETPRRPSSAQTYVAKSGQSAPTTPQVAQVERPLQPVAPMVMESSRPAPEPRQISAMREDMAMGGAAASAPSAVLAATINPALSHTAQAQPAVQPAPQMVPTAPQMASVAAAPAAAPQMVDDVYVPAPAMAAPQESQRRVERLDPFVEADYANVGTGGLRQAAAKEQAQPRRMSLFERALGRKDEPAQRQLAVEPGMSQPQAPAATVTVISPNDRFNAGEDELDIPAFLRRTPS